MKYTKKYWDWNNSQDDLLIKRKTDNELIAEFMCWELQNNPTDRWLGSYREPNGILHKNTNKEPLLFHTSWDWLMPVAEKCLTTDEPTDGQHYFINDALLTCNIDVVYDRVIEFIKEHNQTNKL